MADIASLYNRMFSNAEQSMLFDVINARRDVRGNNFLPTPIAESDLALIFKAANAAPSVGLSQPWEFIVVQDIITKQKVYDNCAREKELAEDGFNDQQKQQYRNLKLDGILQAPINIAVYYNPPQQKIIGNNTMPQTAEYSVVCAIQNMWLMARSLNIGLGWVSIVSPPLIDSLLGVPKHFKLIGYLCLGYSKELLEIPEFEQEKWAARRDYSTAISYEKFNNKINND